MADPRANRFGLGPLSPSGLELIRFTGAAAVLTLLFAAPVLVAPGERIFGNEIAGRHHDPFTVMEQFAGAPVGALYLQPATDWPGRALGHVLSPVAAYNVIVLVTFPLAALFAYLLAIELTASRFASAVAGLAFAFSPFHVAHAAYHPHIAQVQWIALFLLAIWRCVHGFTMRRGLLLIAASGLVALSNFYGGLIAAAMAPVVVVGWWLTPRDSAVPRRRRDLICTIALLAGLALVALLLIRWFVPDVLAGANVPRATRAELFRYSARWWSHFVPPVDHALLGQWSRPFWRQQGIGRELLEQQLYLGYWLVALAGFSTWAWARHRHDPSLRAVPALLALAVIAGVLALSPSREIAGVRTVRPSALLYGLAPMFRSYARFSVVVQLMGAILAGIGAQALWKRPGHFGKSVAVALMAVGMVEYAPVPWRWRDVLPTTGHRWLTEHVLTPRVFDCSPGNRTDGPTAFLAGYPIVYAHPTESECGESSVAARLRADGITHVILRPGSPAWSFLRARTPQGLEPVYRNADSAIFAVKASSPAPFITTGSGWYSREYNERESWRWSGGVATLNIVNPVGSPCTAAIAVELGAFAVSRRLRLFVNGAPVDERIVDVGIATHRLPPIVIPPGRIELSLMSPDPPSSPIALDPGSFDARALSIAVREWSVTTSNCGVGHGGHDDQHGPRDVVRVSSPAGTEPVRGSGFGTRDSGSGIGIGDRGSGIGDQRRLGRVASGFSRKKTRGSRKRAARSGKQEARSSTKERHADRS